MFREKFAPIKKYTIDSQFYQPDYQKSWIFKEIEYGSSVIIDLDLGFYFYINITDNITIKFKNGIEGYKYILFLKVSPRKEITWKSTLSSGNNKGVYIRFADGCKYQINDGDSTDYVYLGGVLRYRDNTSYYLDFIAIAHKLEVMEI